MTYFIYLKIFKTLIFVVLVFGIPYICKDHFLKKFFLIPFMKGAQRSERGHLNTEQAILFSTEVFNYGYVHTEKLNNFSLFTRIW